MMLACVTARHCHWSLARRTFVPGPKRDAIQERHETRHDAGLPQRLPSPTPVIIDCMRVELLEAAGMAGAARS